MVPNKIIKLPDDKGTIIKISSWKRTKKAPKATKNTTQIITKKTQYGQLTLYHRTQTVSVKRKSISPIENW